MTTPKTIRATEPRELLALIPFQLGFHPTDSVVLVSLRPPRRRVGMMARADVVDLAADGMGEQLSRNLAAHLASDGAVGVVLVLYVDDLEAGLEGTAATAVGRLADAVSEAAPVEGLWAVTPSGYHRLSPGLDAVESFPIDDLAGSQVGSEMVYLGSAVAENRAALGRLPVAPASSRRTAERAAREWRARREEPAWEEESVRLWRREQRRDGGPAAAPGRPTAWGRLAAALEDVTVRDAVLISLVPEADGFPEVSYGTALDDERVAWAISAIVDPTVGVPPTPEVCEPSRARLTHVASHSREGSPGALTLLGVIAWWEGGGAEARIWIDRALEVEPGYRLALLISQALDAGMPPGWVRASRPI